MCTSAVTVLADFLDTAGLVAMIFGFFSGITKLGFQSKWSGGVFLMGVISFIVGSRLGSLC